MMSEQENVQIVQRIYDAFGSDLAAILSLMADDVDWKFFGSGRIPWAGPRVGAAGSTNSSKRQRKPSRSNFPT
jgi:ketosteroid isomerase-like protein